MAEQLENNPEQQLNEVQQNPQLSDIPEGIDAQQANRIRWGEITGMVAGTIIGGPAGGVIGKQIGSFLKW